MRFALRSRRGPHASVGSGAPKSLCREIDRRLNAIDHIKSEPWLLKSTNKQLFESEDITQLTPHLYRMKVIDDVKELCRLIKKENIAKSRHIQEDVLHYFVRLHRNNVFLNINIQVLYKFLSLYEHARYQDEVFSYQEYCQFTELLNELKKNFIHSYDASKSATENTHFAEKNLKDESFEPLLINTFSSSTESLTNKFTNETTV
ncbi:protein C1orf43 homolog isoform X3 [Parasteatoda tepidariorum]